MYKAAIDLGTNSLRLLIADVVPNRFTVITDRSELVRLGEGIDASKLLSPQSIVRTLEVMRSFRRQLADFPSAMVRFVATSSLRSVTNADDLLIPLKEMGFEPEIITGEEEARLTAKAIRAFVNPLATNAVYVDQGGGSVEFIHNYQEFQTPVSLEIGVVRLYETWLRDHEPETAIPALKAWLNEQLDTNLRRFKVLLPRQIVITGGSAATLGKIHFGLKDFVSDQIHNQIIPLRSLTQLIPKLTHLNHNEISAAYNIPLRRADLILAGTIQIATILEYFNRDQFTISDKGLRYGLLVE